MRPKAEITLNNGFQLFLEVLLNFVPYEYRSV